MTDEVGVEWMLGVRAGFDALVIDPRAPSGWDGYEVAKLWRGRGVRVVCRRVGGRVRIALRGKEYDGRIPLADLPAFPEIGKGEGNVVEVSY